MSERVARARAMDFHPISIRESLYSPTVCFSPRDARTRFAIVSVDFHFCPLPPTVLHGTFQGKFNFPSTERSFGGFYNSRARQLNLLERLLRERVTTRRYRGAGRLHLRRKNAAHVDA